MNCKDVSRVIMDILSGEATREERELALKHISSCRKCRDELAALTDIEEKLRLVFKASTAKYSVPADILESIKREIAEGKAEVVKSVQDYLTVASSYVVCGFSSMGELINDHVDIYNAIVGKSLTIDDILIIGERITNLRRALNIKFGATAVDDTLPKRMTAEPVNEGAAKGQVNQLDVMLPKYYEIREWDPESGKPSKAKLESLGLNKIAKDLWG